MKLPSVVVVVSLKNLRAVITAGWNEGIERV